MTIVTTDYHLVNGKGGKERGFSVWTAIFFIMGDVAGSECLLSFDFKIFKNNS